MLLSTLGNGRDRVMKLTGSNKGGRHLNKNVKNGAAATQRAVNHGKTETKPKQVKRSRKIPVIVFALIAVVGVSVYFFVSTALSTAPQVKPDPSRPLRLMPDDKWDSKTPGLTANNPGGDGSQSARDPSKYTFLVLGSDDGANTDVIMFVTFDTANASLNVVSIPRDTLINVSWSLKKANSVLANMRYKHGWDDKALAASMDATKEVFSDILGYVVDYWVIVDLKAFEALVDAIDGVEFDIPVRMYYTDPYAGLVIDYQPGKQRLNGKQAAEVVRFRSGYANADIGRIDTQQNFLSSAAQQILAKRNSLSVTELAGIFLKYVKTDLDLSDLIWFGNQFIKMNASKINFEIMPGNYVDAVGNQSYVTIYVNDWLELVNSKLSPLLADITASDVSILTRGSDRYLYVTDGNRQGDPTWGTGSTGISASNSPDTTTSSTASASTIASNASQASAANQTPGTPDQNNNRTNDSDNGEDDESDDESDNTDSDQTLDPDDLLIQTEDTDSNETSGVLSVSGEDPTNPVETDTSA